MPVFDTNRSGTATFTRGFLANRVGNPGSISQAVSDGDTVRVFFKGGQGLRFLGCDTPEKSIEFRKSGFVKLSDKRWEDYLGSVWNDSKWGKFDPPLSASLKAHLKKKIKTKPAANQWKHATSATESLKSLIESDRKKLGLAESSLKIFAMFSHEILDRYGRPLVFTNLDVKEKSKRPDIYNVRMIANGSATPFFMWPNIEPFRKYSVQDAAMAPKRLRAEVNRAKKLLAARKLAAKARQNNLGIYNTSDPLQLHAFELRYLGRRKAPDRWVINIGKGVTDSKLISPDQYFQIPNPEDRLFIPAEYVPLFRTKGWK